MVFCNLDGGDVTPEGICELNSFLATETVISSLASEFAAQSLPLTCVAVGGTGDLSTT